MVVELENCFICCRARRCLCCHSCFCQLHRINYKLSGGDFLIRWSPVRSTMLQVAPASPWVGAEPAALGFVLALANEAANEECPYFWGWNATWLRVPLHGSTWVICSKPVRCAISQYIQWVVSNIYIYIYCVCECDYICSLGDVQCNKWGINSNRGSRWKACPNTLHPVGLPRIPIMHFLIASQNISVNSPSYFHGVIVI